MDGDRETADFYYAKARAADQSGMKVAYATRKDVEGMKLAAVAGNSDDAVVKATEEAAEARRREGGPVVLRYRNNQPVAEPATPPQPIQTEPTTAPPAGNAPGGLMQPLPENRQPPAAQPKGANPPEAQPNIANPGAGGLLMPLPESQQPPAATPPQNNAPQNPLPQQ